jgi:hypothetical protein
VDSPASYWISVPSSTQVPGGSRPVFTYETVTLFGWLSHTILLTERFVTPMCQALQPRTGKPVRFGLFPVRSPLLGEYFLFLWVLRCFSSPGSRLPIYRFNGETPLVRNGRFPYSEIPGSALVHSSPGLIAVSRVLHRHLTPRHPP